MLRIVIAGPDEALSLRLAEVIIPAEGLEVIGTAPDGESTLDVVRRLQPDVVVVDADIAMPPRGGVTLVAAITDAAPGTVVLLLAGEALEETAQAALAAGAMGVLAKDGSAQIPAELWPGPDETPDRRPFPRRATPRTRFSTRLAWSGLWRSPRVTWCGPSAGPDRRPTHVPGTHRGQ